jgi:hypothetical protein
VAVISRRSPGAAHINIVSPLVNQACVNRGGKQIGVQMEFHNQLQHGLLVGVGASNL